MSQHYLTVDTPKAIKAFPFKVHWIPVVMVEGHWGVGLRSHPFPSLMKMPIEDNLWQE